MLVAACGPTTYVDRPDDGPVPLRGAGWQGIEPIAIDLPTADPVAEEQPDLPIPAKPGTPVLVNIWASYCEPCKDELPMLEAVDASGVMEVVGFTRDLKRARAVEALEAAGVTYRNWLDPEATVALSVARIPVNAIPTSILVRDGMAVAVHIGPFPDRATVLAALEIR